MKDNIIKDVKSLFRLKKEKNDTTIKNVIINFRQKIDGTRVRDIIFLDLKRKCSIQWQNN